MSKPRGKKTAEGSGERQATAVAMNLVTAQKMLPLLAQIVQEIQARWLRLTQLESEQLDLDRRRQRLNWPERLRRYQISDELTLEQHRLQEAVIELEQLKVILVDPIEGEAALPTIINGRRAYFVWRTGDVGLNLWCYAHDTTRHKIPASWRAAAAK